MLKDIKNTISQSAVYGLSRVATKLISFILIPLYTAKFSADAIANLNLLESFWQYLFTICMFAFETAIINFCTSEKNISKRNSIIFNFFFLTLINAAVFYVISLSFSGGISEIVLNENNSTVISYCFLISIFESLLIMPMTIARLNSRPGLYTIITISNLVINLSLQLYFILGLGEGFEKVFLAKWIAPAIVFIVFIPYLIKNLSINIDFSEIKRILSFSFPLMLAMLLSILLNSVDRFLLNDFVSKQQVAVYTTGYSIGSFTNAFIIAPFTLAINVIFWNKINDDNFRRFMTKSSTYLFFVMILTSLVITYFIDYAVKIFVRNPELWSCVEIIPIILFSNCFVALFIFSSLDFYYKKNTKTILLIMAICLSFNLIFNFIFIKYFGIYASAVITLLSYLLMTLIGAGLTKKFSFTKFEKAKVILLSVMFVLFSSYSYFVSIENIYLDISIKLVLILLFLLLLHMFKFLEPIEIESLKGFVNKYFIKKLKH
ncbi:MAG TPA: oligosaccharide flippase family protein [Ignavibacteria bacterium]|nr:oligosaccharide flippase family protein [Ignavibacteria bacterium]HRB00088.1 oligosaccharide flippase family protein [Ignavibacteria bacterium]